jgi:hypothetical protein
MKTKEIAIIAELYAFKYVYLEEIVSVVRKQILPYYYIIIIIIIIILYD